MVILIAAITVFVAIAVLAYTFAPPGDRIDEETEWWIIGALLFGDIMGDD